MQPFFTFLRFFLNGTQVINIVINLDYSIKFIPKKNYFRQPFLHHYYA